MISRFLSQKFRFFTFFSIALLVYVHGYNLNETYLTPVSNVNEPLSFTTFFEYFVSNGILRFRIPILFLISGYLYALYDNRPYGERIKKRFTTLIVPYLIWSAVGLLITFLLQQFPFTAQVVKAANIDQLGNNRPYTQIGWGGIVLRWLLVPISYQLWFILVLFIYNLMYPALRWMVLHLPYVLLPLAALLWLSFLNLHFIEGQGLFFFSLGIWLQKKNISLERRPRWFAQGLFWIFFIGINVIKTFMAFELDFSDGTHAPGILFILYNLGTLSGILAVWYGCDDVVRWCMSRKWFNKASAFSFFIYGLHVPLVVYAMKLATQHMVHLPYYRLTCYIFIPALIVLFSIGMARLLRSIFPGLYIVMTGGRGL